MSAVLSKIGLTREQVERLTGEMRPRYESIGATEDPGEFVWKWVSRWGSIDSVKLRLMLRAYPRGPVDRWNEANPDKRIASETLKDGDRAVTFYYLEGAQ